MKLEKMLDPRQESNPEPFSVASENATKLRYRGWSFTTVTHRAHLQSNACNGTIYGLYISCLNSWIYEDHIDLIVITF